MARDETPSTAALVQDRGQTLGNSAGADGRGRLHAFVANTPLEPIPISATFTAYKGVLGLLSAETVTVPGSSQTLISYTLGASENRDIWRMKASCRQSCKFVLSVNGITFGTARSSPGSPDVEILLTPFKITTTGDTIELLAEAISGSAVTDIEGFVMTDLY